jgi:hypothetical protein
MQVDAPSIASLSRSSLLFNAHQFACPETVGGKVYAFLSFLTLVCLVLAAFLSLQAQSDRSLLAGQPHRQQTLQRHTPAAAPAQSSSGLNFAPAVTYSTGALSNVGGATLITSVVVADVNGDGKPDIVAPNVQGSTVAVLLGNGDGTFQPAVTYTAAANGVTSVAVGDVNGDGKPDIVAAVDEAGVPGSVSVLLGNGDGTFRGAVSYPSGGYQAQSVAIADVNGDGKPDLVVSNVVSCTSCTGDGTVAVLLGNGDGTFQTPVSYDSGGRYAGAVAIGDVNGDGKPDIVVTNIQAQPTSNVSVLLGNGDGTFQPAVTYGSGAFQPYSVALADVNGDGKLDLVVTNACVNNDEYCPGDGLVAVLLGNGDGTFKTAVTYDSGSYFAISVAVEDVNGDGKPDIVVANYCNMADGCPATGGPSGVVSVLLGNGDGTFQPAVSWPAGGSYDFAIAVTVADVNHDGKPDIVVANGVFEGIGTNPDGSVGVLINTTAIPTTTQLVSSLNPSDLGQSVTFTATVTVQGTGTPTGTVTFLDSSTQIGTGTLNGSGVTTYTTSSLTTGQHSLTAVYGGDAKNGESTSAVLTQTVNPDPTTTALTSSANPSFQGSPVTFTATVTTSGPATATGTVTFLDSSTQLGTGTLNSSGVATYTTPYALTTGQHSITASYGGDENNAASASAVLTQTVNPASIVLSFSPSSATVSAGNTAQFTLTVAPQGSFTNAINFSCSNLPALASCTFSPSTVTPQSNTVTSNLSISTTARPASLLMPPLSWHARPLPAMWLIFPSLMLTIAGLGKGKHRKLHIFVFLGLLAGSCLFQTACGSGGGSRNTGGTPAGTYAINIIGTAGSAQYTTTVKLTVQ